MPTLDSPSGWWGKKSALCFSSPGRKHKTVHGMEAKGVASDSAVRWTCEFPKVYGYVTIHHWTRPPTLPFPADDGHLACVCRIQGRRPAQTQSILLNARFPSAGICIPGKAGESIGAPLQQQKMGWLEYDRFLGVGFRGVCTLCLLLGKCQLSNFTNFVWSKTAVREKDFLQVEQLSQKCNHAMIVSSPF